MLNLQFVKFVLSALLECGFLVNLSWSKHVESDAFGLGALMGLPSMPQTCETGKGARQKE